MAGEVADLTVEFNEVGQVINKTAEEMDELVDAMRRGGLHIKVLDKLEDFAKNKSEKLFSTEDQGELMRYARSLGIVVEGFNNISEAIFESKEEYRELIDLMAEANRVAKIEAGETDLEDLEKGRRTLARRIAQRMSPAIQLPTDDGSTPGVRKTLNQRTDLILQALQEDQQAALLEAITQVNNTPTRQKLYSLLDDLVKQETLINDKAEEIRGLKNPDLAKADEAEKVAGAGTAGDRSDDPNFGQQGFWTTVNKVRADMDVERRRMELAMLKNQREGGSVNSFLGTYDKEIEQLDALRTHAKATKTDIAELDSEILNLKIKREKKAAENAASGRRDRIRDFNREVDLRSKYLRDQGFLELSSNRRALIAMRERAEAMESIQMGSIQKIQDALKNIDQEHGRRHDTDVQDYAKRINR